MTTSDAAPSAPAVPASRARGVAAPIFGFLIALGVEAAIVGVGVSLKQSGPINPWESFAIALLGGLGCANPVLLMVSGGLIAGPRTRGWGFGLLAGALVGIVVLAVLIYVGFTKAFAYEASVS